jgi:hypothetical protein
MPPHRMAREMLEPKASVVALTTVTSGKRFPDVARTVLICCHLSVSYSQATSLCLVTFPLYRGHPYYAKHV